MKHIKLFEQFLNEKKPKGAPDWHDSDAPDAEGRFKDLSPKDLAAWLIKTRNKDLKKISGSLNQQIVFNRKSDPEYAEKMEKTREEVYKQLGREDLLDKMDESVDDTEFIKINTEDMSRLDFISMKDFLNDNEVDWYTDNSFIVFNLNDLNKSDKETILTFLKKNIK